MCERGINFESEWRRAIYSPFAICINKPRRISQRRIQSGFAPLENPLRCLAPLPLLPKSWMDPKYKDTSSLKSMDKCDGLTIANAIYAAFQLRGDTESNLVLFN